MSQVVQTTTVGRAPYDKSTGLIIGIAVTFLTGIHGGLRFYTGDVGIGILQCLTCGGCWIWSIIDWINYERIVDTANRRAGWTGTTTTTTTVSYQQPQVMVGQQPVVVMQQQPYQQQYQQQPQVVVVQSPPPY